jgi:hypothetical protein
VIIDLEEKSVRFTMGETLTLDQLWGLIGLMGDDDEYGEPDWSLLDDEEPQDWLPGWILPDRIWIVESDVSLSQYCVVRLEDRTWACSCPDFLHRKFSQGKVCKHILRLLWRS